MFSLIITIISIALVAALALATLYYGGTAFNKGGAEADASKILLQGQQILGAADLYFTDKREWPASLAVLESDGYLKQIPVARGPVGEALAAATAWKMVSAKHPVFVLDTIVTPVCQSVNKKAYGIDGVLKLMRPDLIAQCYGVAEAALQVVVSKSSQELTLALAAPEAGVTMGGTTSAPIPAASSTDTSNDGWSVAPGAATTGGATPPAGPPASPAVTFVQDSFTGADGTRTSTAREAEIGGAYFNPYFVRTGFNDCDLAIFGNELRYANWGCNGTPDMFVVSTTPTPTSNYEITLDYTVYTMYAGNKYLELFLVNRYNGATDFSWGNLRLDANGFTGVELKSTTTGNYGPGYAARPEILLSTGTHSVKMTMVDGVLTYSHDGVVVHSVAVPGSTGPGAVGFGMYHNFNQEDITLDNFKAVTLP